MFNFSQSKVVTKSPINEIIDDMFDNFSIGYDVKTRIPSNIYKTAEGSLIEVPMTGIPKESVSVEVSNGLLTVKGKVEKKAEGTLLHNKLSRRDVSATFSLPVGTQPEDVSSSLKDGLLTINIKSNKTQPKSAVAIKVE